MKYFTIINLIQKPADADSQIQATGDNIQHYPGLLNNRFYSARKQLNAAGQTSL